MKKSVVRAVPFIVLLSVSAAASIFSTTSLAADAVAPDTGNRAATLSAASVVLTETNVALSTSGTLSISDVDSPPTFVAKKNVKGAYGTFNIDSAGAWAYVTKSAMDKISEGESLSDSFTVTSIDGTTTNVQITINGTSDPAILGIANVEMDEANDALSASGRLSISDVDSAATFVAQNNIAGTSGTFNIDTAGTWTYVANSAFDNLNVGQSVSDTFTVASADGTITSVSITINGTNDAAILSQASVELDETNEPLTTSGTLSISDVDSPETFEEQSNIAGTNGTFSINTDGAWSYLANSAYDELNVGKSVRDSFTVTSADGTTTKVKIAINGSNDAAILDSASAILDETNASLTTTGKLSISDVDSVQTFVAKRRVKGVNGTLSIDTAGAWIYMANSAFDNLNVGQSVSDTFAVASADGTTANVQVTINGTNDPAALGIASVVLDETNNPLSTGGTLSIEDVDSALSFVAESNIAGTNGIFNIDADGRWTYVTNSALDNLNVGQSVGDSFTVASSDGTTTTVQIIIIGTNDAAILSPVLVTLDEIDAPLTTSGTLSISDVDSATTLVAQNDTFGAYGTFGIDAAGAWTYVANSAFDDLNVGQSVSDKFTVVSADGTTTSVDITINGTNDAAILSQASVELDETNEPLTTSGTLSISDVDSAATFVAQKNTVSAYGTFNINAAGAWSYVAKSAFDSLLVGQIISDSLVVASADGTTTKVQVTINGTNEAAILSSAHVLLSETNEVLRALGTLIISDVDSPETFVAQSNVAGTNGIFNIDTAGRWTYETNSALGELIAGQSVDESFTVASADGTTTTVQVTIIGTNDAAILGAASVSLDEINAPLNTSGTLSITDVDSAATFVAQNNIAGTSGTFNVDTAGRWTYVANSAFDNLNVGQSVSDAFTVSSADGTTTNVQITINGTNDPAILGIANVEMDEANDALSASGRLSISDVDSAATFVAREKIKGKNGSLKIDAAGVWAYVANSAFDNLNVGQSVSDTFTVASADGTTTMVQVTIKGTNDPATLGAANVILTETNSVLRATGRLRIKDVDNPVTFATQSNAAGANGTFSIDTSGRWIYLTSSAFDYLNEGESISDSFTVASEDGTTTSVKVTIEGSEESRFNGIWVAGKAGINRSNLDELKTRSALTYGFEEGYNWEVGILQLGAYGSYELNTTATGPVNYNSQVIGAGAKLGFPKGKWLLYGKLGYARTNGGGTAIKIGANHIYRGLGIEYKFANHWSVAGEYTNSNGNAVIQTVERRLRNKNIMIGLNYYVGVPAKTKPPAPVSTPTPATAPVVEPAIGPAPAPQPVPTAPTTAPAFEPSFGAAPQPASPATAPVPVLEPAFGPVPAPTPQPVPLVPAPAVQVVPLPPAPVQGVEPAFGPAPSPAPVPQPAPPVPAPEPAFEPAF